MAPTEHCAMTRAAAVDATLGDRPMGDTRLPYDEIFTSWFGRWLRDAPDDPDAPDTPDARPDGTAYNVADTCLRLRYRDSLSRPEPLVPGQVYRIELRGITTASYFPPGHRIRIEIAGSSFPYRDRNWNTGGQNELGNDGPIAHIALHHGPDHSSLIPFREYTGPTGEIKLKGGKARN
jgi:predicted acyl esterase